MNVVGQKERATQDRVLKLFTDALGYEGLGSRAHADNRNIDPDTLTAWLLARHGGRGPGPPGRPPPSSRRTAANATLTPFDRNRAVYDLLRYGVKLKPDVGENTVTVHLIDWKQPLANRFAVAEEFAVAGAGPKAAAKRPDVVLLVNGIALAVLELKRSTVDVAEGIRQQIDSQRPEYIGPFFSTVQYVMAGNDTQGLRYGTTGTPERYYLQWVEDGPAALNPLDRHLTQVCRKERLLELIHDFVVFDCGTKKLSRHNQYFGVTAARGSVRRREGGIIWHTQGSGKSLTMVWLARWIRENVTDARVLLVTDRTELDEQIEKVFLGVNEQIVRAASGADLVARLGAAKPWLLCSLVHKFGGKGPNADLAEFATAVKKAAPPGFRPMGNLFVFVDECHRTQSGDLHRAMTALLPDAVLIGFTGTPLLKADKARSVETFGPYIHTYKFHEAVRDRVVLDLRYEARDIEQSLTSQKKVDEWFEAKTRGLTDHARGKLKARWGTLKQVLSSRDRLQRIVNDILLDLAQRPRLADGRGNALLVSGSIAQACKLYDLFAATDLRGKVAIVTSYRPDAAPKGEDSGEALAERLAMHQTYRKMLADWFGEPEDQAVGKVELFEKQAKTRFKDQPGQLKLLIVVDKLLTGFDAPPATYLYIDKSMRDHGLFQAICRVNRLDGDDKEYGYVVDYKDLFKSLAGAVEDYTGEAFDGFDPEDVSGLLADRLRTAKERLDDALLAARALCEEFDLADADAGRRHFVGDGPDGLKASEPRRPKLYKLVPDLLRAYAAVAGEMAEAGYSASAAATIKGEVARFEALHAEVKAASGDAIDLKLYDPAMRHLIDTYIRAAESERLTAFEDLTLVQLLVERGPQAVAEALPAGLAESEGAVAETIENNVRRAIVDETPVNPKYYAAMSALLDALIAQRRADAITYAEYLRRVAELAKGIGTPGGGGYPSDMTRPGLRALYDNLERDADLAGRVDAAVRASRQDDWRGHRVKTLKVRNALRPVLGDDEAELDRVMDLVASQRDY